MDVVWDVQKASHISSVQVVDEGDAEGARRQVSEFFVFFLGFVQLGEGPRGVVLSSIALLVGSNVGSSFCKSDFWFIELIFSVVIEGSVIKSPTGFINTVNIDVLGKLVECDKRFKARSGHFYFTELSVLIEAVVLNHGVVGLGVSESVPEAHVGVGGGGVHTPVSDSVSDGVSLEVGLEDAVI